MFYYHSLKSYGSLLRKAAVATKTRMHSIHSFGVNKTEKVQSKKAKPEVWVYFGYNNVGT